MSIVYCPLAAALSLPEEALQTQNLLFNRLPFIALSIKQLMTSIVQDCLLYPTHMTLKKNAFTMHCLLPTKSKNEAQIAKQIFFMFAHGTPLSDPKREIQTADKIEKLSQNIFKDFIHRLNDTFMDAYSVFRKKLSFQMKLEQVLAVDPPVRLENGALSYTPRLIHWMISSIMQHFPMINTLICEIPTYEITKSLQSASIIESMTARCDEPFLRDSSMNVYEKIHGLLLSFSEEIIIYPLLNIPFYLHSYFTNSNDAVIDETILAEQLCRMSEAYVIRWLEQEGTGIEFCGRKMQSGNKSAEWILALRDVYTQYLLSLEANALKREVETVINCPFIKLILLVCSNEEENYSQASSQFPQNALEMLLNEQLEKNREISNVHQALVQMLQNSCFEQSEVILELAERAKRSSKDIEGLIRVRVVYVMCCLAQDMSQSILGRINVGSTGIDDPIDCRNPNSLVLAAIPEQRLVYQFNESFSAFKVQLKMGFIGQNQREKIIRTEIGYRFSIRDLFLEAEFSHEQEAQCNLFTSNAQFHYLMKQMPPAQLKMVLQSILAEINESGLVKKTFTYCVAQQENQQKRNTWVGWLWPTRFCPTSYQDTQNDSEALESILASASLFCTCLRVQSVFSHFCQFSHMELLEIGEHVYKIYDRLGMCTKMLQEIYPSENREYSIAQKMYALKNLSHIAAQTIRSFSSHHSSEKSLQRNRFYNECEKTSDIIGKGAEAQPKGWGIAAWDNTLGYMLKLKEPEEVCYISWKIDRYERLIQGLQKAILTHISKSGLEKALDLATISSDNPEWLTRMSPILILCRKALRKDKERFNQAYLAILRKTYKNNFLGALREAARWAQENSSVEGAHTIDSLCYEFYTELDLNQVSTEICRTFVELGKSASPPTFEPDHSMKDTKPKSVLLQEVLRSYHLMKAAPVEARIPVLKRWMQSLVGHLNGIPGMKFDPAMESNPIHCLFNLKVKKTNIEGAISIQMIKDLGFGSPTCEDGDGVARITDDFRAFLRHCKKIGRRHLYNNQQNCIPQPWLQGNEAPRCRVLHDFADKEFPNHLIVITLSQNSPFYKQQGYECRTLSVASVKKIIINGLLDGYCKLMQRYIPVHLRSVIDMRPWILEQLEDLHAKEFKKISTFIDKAQRMEFLTRFHHEFDRYLEEQLQKFPIPPGNAGVGYSIYTSSAERFKTELLAQIFAGSPEVTGNLIPRNLVEQFDLHNWARNAVEAIHRIVFSHTRTLSLLERRVFTRLLYHMIFMKILFETGAMTYNTSCKDRIDRGAVTDAEFFAYLAILADCINHPKIIEEIQTLIFARAFMVRKRLIIEERLEGLLETVDFMIEKPVQLKQLQRELFPGIVITNDRFPESEPIERKMNHV